MPLTLGQPPGARVATGDAVEPSGRVHQGGPVALDPNALGSQIEVASDLGRDVVSRQVEVQSRRTLRLVEALEEHPKGLPGRREEQLELRLR